MDFPAAWAARPLLNRHDNDRLVRFQGFVFVRAALVKLQVVQAHGVGQGNATVEIRRMLLKIEAQIVNLFVKFVAGFRVSLVGSLGLVVAVG